MVNLINLVKKEFRDLLSSRMILVILLGYLVVISFQIFYTYTILSGGRGSQFQYGGNLGLALSNWLFSMLAVIFGPILGIMIGCTSIANERYKNTINTLLVKPVFRDTIINGKLIGALLFLSLILGVTMIFYTSFLFIFFSDALAPTLYDYVFRLPFVFFISLILIAIFLVGSMLISLLVKNQAFAMILSTLLLYMSNNLNTANFALPLASIFPEHEYVIYNILVNATPTGPLTSIRDYLFNGSISLLNATQLIFPELVKFLLFVVIGCVLCYIIFIRSDIS